MSKHPSPKPILGPWGWIFVLGVVISLYYCKRDDVPTSGTNTQYVHIPTGATLDELAHLLQQKNLITDKTAFKAVAQKRKLSIRAGRFGLKKGMKAKTIITALQKDKQIPIRLVLNNKRTKADIAQQVARYLEADSASLMAMMNDTAFLKPYGYDAQSVVAAFIPNTYEFFWNTNAEGFLKRMHREQKSFWNESRLGKAKDLDLTPAEVITLASIVEKETNADGEKDRIAGVYLNRLRQDWKLEADPTVVFAWGDFSMRRVLKRHTQLDSPYNTYYKKGLPPGPICIPSIATIDKTLEAESHEYMYFCAKADNSGTHTFAKTLEQHQVNARKYHKYIRMQQL